MNVTLFKMLHGNKLYPSKSYLNDAGYNIYLPQDIYLEPNSVRSYKLDVAINWTFDLKDIAVISFPKIAPELYGKVFYTTSTVDPGYEGSIYLMVHNATNEIIKLQKGDPVLEVMFVKLYEHVDMTNILKDGVRGKSTDNMIK